VLQAARRCDRAWYGDDDEGTAATTTAEEAGGLQVRSWDNTVRAEWKSRSRETALSKIQN